MKCPACGSTRIFPSRLRNGIERLRQVITDKQPYRCHQCNWRKWRDVEIHPNNSDVHPEDLRTGQTPRPISPKDIDSLDAAS